MFHHVPQHGRAAQSTATKPRPATQQQQHTGSKVTVAVFPVLRLHISLTLLQLFQESIRQGVHPIVGGSGNGPGLGCHRSPEGAAHRRADGRLQRLSQFGAGNHSVLAADAIIRTEPGAAQPNARPFTRLQTLSLCRCRMRRYCACVSEGHMTSFVPPFLSFLTFPKHVKNQI